MAPSVDAPGASAATLRDVSWSFSTFVYSLPTDVLRFAHGRACHDAVLETFAEKFRRFCLKSETLPTRDVALWFGHSFSRQTWN